MSDLPLWLGREVIEATKGRARSDNWSAEGVAIDSRTVNSGDLFVAIKGPSFDGHDFAAKALEAGAVAVLVSHRPEGLPDNANVVLVDDALAALEDLGRAARTRSQAKIIAVTGSVGKTGTKEALAHILAAQGKTHWSVGSFNNHWGVPLSLARMRRDTQFGIFELGMNHAGELGPLSQMVNPHVAIITTIAAAHLEFFENVEKIARAKAEIFEGLLPEGCAILNRDNEFCDLLAGLAMAAGISNIVTFGENDVADCRLLDVTLKADCSDISASIMGQKVKFTLSVAGRHWVQNTLAVLAAVKSIGGDLLGACEQLGSLKAPNGRGVQLSLDCVGGRYTVIDESYNASPIAMRAAFAVLEGMEPVGGGRKIAVLGEMRELGTNASEIHRDLAKDITANGIDMVYACCSNMKHLTEALPTSLNVVYADNSDGLVEPLRREIKAGDIVLIKGSLGSKMKVVLDALIDGSNRIGNRAESGGQ